MERYLTVPKLIEQYGYPIYTLLEGLDMKFRLCQISNKVLNPRQGTKACKDCSPSFYDLGMAIVRGTDI